MTIGNLSSKIRQVPLMRSIIMVALVPIPIKNRNNLQMLLNQQRQTNQEVLNKELQWVLQPLTFKQNSTAKSGHYNILCADDNFRRSKPVSAAWLEDCPEHCDIHQLERHVCLWCECPKNELGDYVHPDKQHPRRDHNLSRMIIDANTKVADAEPLSGHVHWGFNVFRNIPCIVSNLPNPDLHYTMQIGMPDHLQKWIFHSKKQYERLDKHNAIRLSVAACHDLTLKNTSDEKVSQWNAKEMRGGTCLELLPGLYPREAPLSVLYSIAQLSAPWHC